MEGLDDYRSSSESSLDVLSVHSPRREDQPNGDASSSALLNSTDIKGLPIPSTHLQTSPRTTALLNSKRTRTDGDSTPEEGEVISVTSTGNGTPLGDGPPSVSIEESGSSQIGFQSAPSRSTSITGITARESTSTLPIEQDSHSNIPSPHIQSQPKSHSSVSILNPIHIHSLPRKPITPPSELSNIPIAGITPLPMASTSRVDSTHHHPTPNLSPPPPTSLSRPITSSPRKETHSNLDRVHHRPVERTRSPEHDRSPERIRSPKRVRSPEHIRPREDGDRRRRDRYLYHEDDERRLESADKERERERGFRRTRVDESDDIRAERGGGGERTHERDIKHDRSRDHRSVRRDPDLGSGSSHWRPEEGVGRMDRDRRRQWEKEPGREIDREGKNSWDRSRGREDIGGRSRVGHQDRKGDRFGGNEDGRDRYQDDRGRYSSHSDGYRRNIDQDFRAKRDELPYDDSYHVKSADRREYGRDRGGDARPRQRSDNLDMQDVNMRDRDASSERSERVELSEPSASSRRREESRLPRRPSPHYMGPVETLHPLPHREPPPHQLPPPPHPPPPPPPLAPPPRSPSASPLKPGWSPVVKPAPILPLANKRNGLAGDDEASHPFRKRVKTEEVLEPSAAPPPEPPFPLPPPPDMTPPPVPPGTSPPLENSQLPEPAKEPPPPSAQIDLSNGVSVPPTPNPNLLKVGPISKPATPAPRNPASSSLKASRGMKSVRAIGRHLDPQREEVVYGRTFSGVVKIQTYLRPKTSSDIKEATLGKGTFGLVTLATRMSDDKRVALKLLQNPPSDDGKSRPQQGILGSTLREIKLLKLLQHENIVQLLEIIVDRKQDGSSDTYLVFPYMDHDLCGLLKNKAFDNRPRILKLYMLQLLEGAAFMHHNNIIHRDLKSANLLIDNQGNLQIADFGLARPILTHPVDDRNDYLYTNMVVTRWYRAPELIMGESLYGAEVDIWSIGCIFGEMYSKNVLLNGNSDVDQLVKIFHLCGTPPPDYEKFHSTLVHNSIVNDNRKLDPREHVTVKEVASMEQRRRIHEFSSAHVTPEFVSLLDRILVVNPAKRPTAIDLLNDKFFWLDPPPLAKADVIPLDASKERRDQLEAEETAHAVAAANHQKQQQQQHQVAVAQSFVAAHQQNQMAAAAAMHYAVAGQPMSYGNDMRPNGMFGMNGMNGMNGMHQGNGMPMAMPPMGRNPYTGGGPLMRPNYIQQHQQHHQQHQHQHQHQHQQQHQRPMPMPHQHQQSMPHQRPQFGPGVQQPHPGLPPRPHSVFTPGTAPRPPRGLNFAGAHGQGIGPPPVGRPHMY